MNKEDFENFEASFQHIDDILKVLADELDQQLRDQHMSYVVEWVEKDTFGFEDFSDSRKRIEFIKVLIAEALHVSYVQAIMPIELIGQHKDPWSRVKGFMALRQTSEQVQSPIAAEEYEQIKEIAIEAERQKPINLESIPVNMQRPEWTEAEQMALLMKKEKDEPA